MSSMIQIHTVSLCAVVAGVVLATVTDLRSRRIPNWLVGPLLVAGVAISAAAGGWAGLRHSVLAILLATAALGFFWMLGGMGMGDVKLCAAVGAWIGPAQLAMALLLMGLAGGVMSLGWILAGKYRKSRRVPAGSAVDSGQPPKPRGMPYAPAIAIGVICSFLGR